MLTKSVYIAYMHHGTPDTKLDPSMTSIYLQVMSFGFGKGMLDQYASSIQPFPPYLSCFLLFITLEWRMKWESVSINGPDTRP